MERQHLSHAQLRERFRGKGQKRSGRDPARDRACASGHGADGRQSRARPLGRSHRPARRLCLDPGPAHYPCRLGAVSRHRPGARASDLAGCRRRLRLQMHPTAGRAVRGVAGAEIPTAVPLRRGSPRASGGRRQLTTTSLPADRPCRRTRQVVGARCGHHDRRRRVLGVAVHRGVGTGTGNRQPSRTLRFPRLPLPDPVRGDEQARLPALSRRRPDRRLFRHGVGDRRDRARGRPRAVGGPPRQSRRGRRHALRQRCAQTLRQRRLSQGAQRRGERDGRLIGVGFASYCEQSAHGTSVFSGWGLPIIPGYDQATVRVTPDGGLEVRAGVHSHGQGMETTLAQIAHEVTGIDLANIRVLLGDTGSTPYSTGTYASRSIVMAGGAVANACKTLIPRFLAIGAHLMQAAVVSMKYENGKIIGPRKSISLREVAEAWYLRPQELPPDVDLGGLEATVGFRPKRDTGAFSYASHAAVVAADTKVGAVEILDYVIVEDCGTLVNPMVVEGQTLGGAAQGIGTALYEESPFDPNGQPLASTFADYLLPGPTEIPAIRIHHMETPSPYTEFGIKGMGEGGAIAPPAVIFNAVNDALRPLGVELTETPLTPRRLLEAIDRAKASTQPRMETA